MIYTSPQKKALSARRGIPHPPAPSPSGEGVRGVRYLSLFGRCGQGGEVFTNTTLSKPDNPPPASSYGRH